MNFLQYLWYERYWLYGKIKDFFTLKANKRQWHQVTLTYERYPYGFMSDHGITKLFMDGKLVDEAGVPPQINEFSMGIWFNPKNNKPYIRTADEVDPK